MNPKTFFMPRIVGVVLLTMALLGLIHPAVLAVNLNTYGNLYLETAARNENESFTTANPALATDLSTYSSGDIFVRGSEENTLFQFLIDYRFEGNFQDSGSTSAAGYANQYYIMIPFHETAFLYCGQKYKKVGGAKFFNITNRYERAGYPVKLVEYDMLHSDNLNYGFVANFKGAAQWADVQDSGFFDLSLSNFNMQGYCFKEGTRGCSLAADLAYQAGAFQFYGAALWMSQGDQVVAILNSASPADSSGDVLDYRDQNSAAKFLAGMMINQKNYSVTCEYMANNEAYNPRERNDFIAYLQRHPGGRQYYTDYFSYNWAQNYLGLNVYLPRVGNDECSLRGSVIASVPAEGMGSEYSSYQASLNFAYNLNQNLTANFNITHRCGGAKGEYLNLYEDRTRYQLSLLFSF